MEVQTRNYDIVRRTLSGIEDGQTDTSGYVCQHLGNLECQAGQLNLDR